MSLVPNHPDEEPHVKLSYRQLNSVFHALRAAEHMLTVGHRIFNVSNFTDRGGDGPRFTAAMENVKKAIAELEQAEKEEQ